MAGLDIAGLAQDLVPVAMELAGTAKKTATLHLGKTEAYDPNTGAPSESGGSDVEVEGIFWKEGQRQGVDVTSNDRFFLIEADKLPSKPTESDTLTVDGDVWQVKDTEFDPTGTIAILTLRR